PRFVPVEGPEHRVDAGEQGAEQLLALAEPFHLGTAVHQREGQLLDIGKLQIVHATHPDRPLPSLVRLDAGAFGAWLRTASRGQVAWSRKNKLLTGQAAPACGRNE